MKFDSIARSALAQVKFIAVILGVLWVLETIDTLLLGQALNRFGIVPRDIEGLRGIVFAPLLHNGFGHLASNTLPLAVFSALLLVRGWRDYAVVTALVMLICGLGVWLIAPSNSVHIGASGVIFGYFGFLLLRGVFDRNPLSLLIALGVGVVYGGIIWGVLPGEAMVSWQSHLFGFVGGGVAARVMAPERA
jgi:membrane associated rhomboid family serine protease